MALSYEQKQHTLPIKNDNTAYFKTDTGLLNPTTGKYDLNYRNETVPDAEAADAGNCVVKDAEQADGVAKIYPVFDAYEIYVGAVTYTPA